MFIVKRKIGNRIGTLKIWSANSVSAIKIAFVKDARILLKVVGREKAKSILNQTTYYV